MRRGYGGLILWAALMAAGTASAAENCGSMLHTMSRFRGTIRSVRRLTEGAVNVIPVDTDASFAVTIDIDSVEADTTALRAGEKLTFAIHSPSRAFGSGRLVGRAFDLEAMRTDCHGVFWRFSSLQKRRPSTVVQKFDGPLEVGHTYRAQMKPMEDGLALVGTLDLPMHHEGDVNFINVGALFEKKNTREIVFEIVALHITQTG